MLRKFTAAVAAVTLALTAFAPGVASARDRGYWGGHDYYGGRHYRHRDNDGDAVAAGVVGLVLGLAVGAAVSQPRTPRYASSCYNGCYAPPPPPPCRTCYAPGSYGPAPGYYREGYAPQPYYQQGYDDRGYDPRYDESGLDGGYYERGGCTRPERQWDRYANRYVTVDVPC